MGTPQVAADTLSALIKAGHEVVLVVSQPDSRKGRHLNLQATHTKQVAIANKLTVFQPQLINNPESIKVLQGYEADIFIVVAYGKILAIDVLNIPKLGCYNLHYSLLPRWRGAAPIQFCLLNGDSKTGVSLIKMNELMDQGPIVAQAEYSVKPAETFWDLQQKLCLLGIDLLVKTLPALSGCDLIAQNDSQASYSSLLSKKAARVDWEQSALKIFWQWRAFYPKLHTFFNQRRLILKKIKLLENANDLQKTDRVPGSILPFADGFKIVCGVGEIFVQTCQWAGKKENDAAGFLRGMSATQRQEFFTGKFS